MIQGESTPLPYSILCSAVCSTHSLSLDRSLHHY